MGQCNHDTTETDHTSAPPNGMQLARSVEVAGQSRAGQPHKKNGCGAERSAEGNGGVVLVGEPGCQMHPRFQGSPIRHPRPGLPTRPRPSCPVNACSRSHTPRVTSHALHRSRSPSTTNPAQLLSALHPPLPLYFRDSCLVAFLQSSCMYHLPRRSWGVSSP